MTRQRLIVAAALVVAAALHLRFLREPLERDEGAYAYIATRILAGEVPYRDVFDHKPPGVHYTYAAAFLLGGSNATTVRLLGALAGVLATAAAGLAAATLFSRRAGVHALLLATPLLASPQLQATMANTEIFLAGPAALHVALTWRAHERRRARLAFAAGALAGIAALYKPVAGTGLVAALAFEALEGRGRGGARRAAAQAAGFALPWLATLAAFALAGAAGDFVRDVFSYNVAYAAAGANGGLDRLARPLLEVAAGFVFLALLGLWTGLREAPRQAVLALFWLGGALVGVSASGRYFPHYFIQALSPIAVLAALAVEPLRAHRKLALVAAGLLTFSLARETRWFLRSPEELSRVKYGGPICLDALAIAAELKQRVAPGALVLVWGAEPEIHFYAGTRAPRGFLSTFERDAATRPLPPGDLAAIVLASYAPENPSVTAALSGYEPVATRGDLTLLLPAAAREASLRGGRCARPDPLPCATRRTRRAGSTRAAPGVAKRGARPSFAGRRSRDAALTSRQKEPRALLTAPIGATTSNAAYGVPDSNLSARSRRGASGPARTGGDADKRHILG